MFASDARIAILEPSLAPSYAWSPNTLFCRSLLAYLPYFDIKGCGGLTSAKRRQLRRHGESVMLSWLERLDQARAELAERDSDPWRRVLERALPADLTAVSTTALCDLLGIRPTTGNARRIARSMRAMGFFPIKSRRLQPGGWRGSEGRGWARPIRQAGHK